MNNKGKKNAKVGTVNTKFLLVAGGVAVLLVVILSAALMAFYGVDEFARGGDTTTVMAGETLELEDFSDGFDMELMSMDDIPEPTMIPLLDETAVATVNGIGINATDIGFRIREAEHVLSNEYFTMFPDDWDFDYDREFRNGATFGQVVREEAVRRSAMHVLYSQYAAQHGITLSEDDFEMIRQELEMMEMQFGDEFGDMLRVDGIQNVAHLEDLFAVYSLMEYVVTAIIDDPVKFAEFEHLLEEAEEIEEELLGAKHILAGFDNFDSPEEAEAFAEALLARALAGEDFDMLIREYGQDPGMASNPDGYTFTSGAMVPEFENATLALAIGEISGLVPSNFGIHIIKRVEPNPDGDVMRPWGAPQAPTLERRMMDAVLSGFEAKLDDVEIVFHSGLNDIPVEW